MVRSCALLLGALLVCSAEDIHDGYVTVPNVEATPGDPALMTGYSLVDAARSDNAVCLDGSPGFYYHRPGTGTGVDKWYVHMEGGGWCSSIGGCQGRSLTHLGSSVNYTKTISQGYGYFSVDNKTNPLMYNWNSVFFKYCDGGSFSGSNASSTPSGKPDGSRLHWRGRHILDGGVTDMLKHRGLAQAAEVVVSGCSAGGLATFLHCEHWAKRIHTEGANASAKVVCMPDSGLFRDYEGYVSPGVCHEPHYHDKLVWVFEQMNASVNDACLAGEVAAGRAASNCMFAEHTMRYLETPTFPLQSEYDQWQVLAVLGILKNRTQKIPSSPAQAAIINQYGANMTAVVHANLLTKPQHSVFLDSCYHHCGGWGDYHAGAGNQTQPFAMREWYEGLDSPLAEPKVQKTWIQGKAYPCEACCI